MRMFVETAYDRMVTEEMLRKEYEYKRKYGEFVHETFEKYLSYQLQNRLHEVQKRYVTRSLRRVAFEVSTHRGNTYYFGIDYDPDRHQHPAKMYGVKRDRIFDGNEVLMVADRFDGDALMVSMSDLKPKGGEERMDCDVIHEMLLVMLTGDGMIKDGLADVNVWVEED